MEFKINIQKKHFFILLVAILVVGGAMVVVSYGSVGAASVLGHTAYEVEPGNFRDGTYVFPGRVEIKELCDQGQINCKAPSGKTSISELPKGTMIGFGYVISVPTISYGGVPTCNAGTGYTGCGNYGQMTRSNCNLACPSGTTLTSVTTFPYVTGSHQGQDYNGASVTTMDYSCMFQYACVVN